MNIPIRETLAAPFQASKWMKHPVLLDVTEMKDLLSALDNCWIVQTSGVISKEHVIITKKNFLEMYEKYLQNLRNGISSMDFQMRSFFSSVFTSTLDALYLYRLPKNEKEEYLVKVCLPVIQLQAHNFHYSSEDDSFRSMAFGQTTFSWGIQFSYPHMYQDNNFKMYAGKEMEIFPNTSLYKKLQQWIRSHTTVTTIEAKGKRKNIPIRVGKNCGNWVEKLPQFTSQEWHIISRNNRN